MLRALNRVGRVVRLVASVQAAAGAVLMGTLVLIITTDIIARYFFNNPVKGASELAELGMGISVALLLADTAMTDRHIRVDIVTALLPEPFQRRLNGVTDLAFVAIIALISWQTFNYIGVTRFRGITTAVLLIPIYPFVLLITIGFVTLTLAVLFTLTITMLRKSMSDE